MMHAAHCGTGPPPGRDQIRHPLPSALPSSSDPRTYVPIPISLETRPIQEPYRSSLETSRTLAHPLKEARVHKAHKLDHVDHVVKSLNDIWKPHDIPVIFTISSRQPVLTSLANNSIHLATPPHLHNAQNNHDASTPRYTQLPAPTTRTHLTPFAFPVSISSVRPARSERTATAIFEDPARSNAASLKSFVHQVLRRSQTSSCVLQTALRYLEGIRDKVPEYVRQERQGNGIRGEVDQSERVLQIEELGQSSVGGEQFLLDSMDPFCPDYIDFGAATTRIPDIVAAPLATPSEPSTQCSISIHTPKLTKSETLTPLPPLPSPLLCPRRAFLAALILASKFMKDKCHSNRAWAKLVGLPPREIGRCERALGEALEWCLWVDKIPPGEARYTVSRSASESGVDTGSIGSSMSTLENISMPGPSTLRRTSTVPSEVFVPLVPQQHLGFSRPAVMTAFPPMISMSSTSCVDHSVRLSANSISILSEEAPFDTLQLYTSPSSTDNKSP